MARLKELQTHCKNGHAFTPDNVRVNRKGGRSYHRCKACDSTQRLLNYSRHRDERLDYARTYRKAHKSQIAMSQRGWRENNPEAVRRSKRDLCRCGAVKMKISPTCKKCIKPRTHCKRGHKFTAGRFQLDRKGGRHCNICKSEWRSANSKRLYAANIERNRSWSREFYYKRGKVKCPTCDGVKALNSTVCAKCIGLARTMVGAGGRGHDRTLLKKGELLLLLPDLNNPNLQRSYTWLKKNKAKLQKARQLLKQKTEFLSSEA